MLQKNGSNLFTICTLLLPSFFCQIPDNILWPAQGCAKDFTLLNAPCGWGFIAVIAVNVAGSYMGLSHPGENKGKTAAPSLHSWTQLDVGHERCLAKISVARFASNFPSAFFKREIKCKEQFVQKVLELWSEWDPFAGLFVGGHSNSFEMLEVFPFLHQENHCIMVVGQLNDLQGGQNCSCRINKRVIIFITNLKGRAMKNQPGLHGEHLGCQFASPEFWFLSKHLLSSHEGSNLQPNSLKLCMCHSTPTHITSISMAIKWPPGHL